MTMYHSKALAAIDFCTNFLKAIIILYNAKSS